MGIHKGDTIVGANSHRFSVFDDLDAVVTIVSTQRPLILLVRPTPVPLPSGPNGPDAARKTTARSKVVGIPAAVDHNEGRAATISSGFWFGY